MHEVTVKGSKDRIQEDSDLGTACAWHSDRRLTWSANSEYSSELVMDNTPDGTTQPLLVLRSPDLIRQLVEDL